MADVVLQVLQEVPLAEIEVDPENVRTSYDPDEIEGLRELLRREGRFINPPTVYPVGGTRFRVKHGNTRVLAAKGVVASLPVVITEPPSSAGEKVLAQLSENLLQGGLNSMDVARALKGLYDGEGLSLGMIVGHLKEHGIVRTRAWVQVHLELTRLHASVQEAIAKGEITARHGYLLRGRPEIEQLQWLAKVREGNLSGAELARELGAPDKTTEDAFPSAGPLPLPTSQTAGEVPTEWSLAQLTENINEAAQELDQSQRRAHGTRQAQVQRPAPITSRWELLPLEPELLDQVAGDSKAKLERSAWAKSASESEKALALEVVHLSGQTIARARQIASATFRDLPQARPEVVSAMNALRPLIEKPELLAEARGVSELLRLRLSFLLQRTDTTSH